MTKQPILCQWWPDPKKFGIEALAIPLEVGTPLRYMSKHSDTWITGTYELRFWPHTLEEEPRAAQYAGILHQDGYWQPILRDDSFEISEEQPKKIGLQPGEKIEIEKAEGGYFTVRMGGRYAHELGCDEALGCIAAALFGGMEQIPYLRTQAQHDAWMEKYGPKPPEPQKETLLLRQGGRVDE